MGTRENIRLAHANVVRDIADKKPIPTHIVRKYLLAGNSAVRRELEGLALVEPAPRKEYDVAVKQCVDARAVSTDLDFLLLYRTIHERTAGNIVRTGHVFKVLEEYGVGFVEGHQGCGAVGAAHAFHRDEFTGTPNPDLLRILTSIPYAVATLGDLDACVSENAVVQAALAKVRLAKEFGMQRVILPSVLRWSPEPSISAIENRVLVQTLDVNASLRVLHILKAMERALKSLFGAAIEEGRTFDEQYSHSIIIYDPYRLGRINDARVIFGLLPNEAFCVTFDFRRLLNGATRPLSRTGLGSIAYAAFHDGGHVLGVGNQKDAVPNIIVLDPDETALERARASLLGMDAIRAGTHNGETILLAKYDPCTASVEFIS